MRAKRLPKKSKEPRPEGRGIKVRIALIAFAPPHDDIEYIS